MFLFFYFFRVYYIQTPQYFSGASKHDKISSHSSLGLQRWSPTSPSYLNNISVSAGSSSASASTTPSPTPQSTSNVPFNRLTTPQTFGYHQQNAASQACTSSSSLANIISNSVSTTNTNSAMPTFAGGQESQYGRPVKLVFPFQLL